MLTLICEVETSEVALPYEYCEPSLKLFVRRTLRVNSHGDQNNEAEVSGRNNRQPLSVFGSTIETLAPVPFDVPEQH